MKLRRGTQKLSTLVLAFSMLLTACSKKPDLDLKPDPMPNTTTTTLSTTINQPVDLNLLMVNDDGYLKRLLMTITQVGSKPVSLKTVFDTGSEGMVLNASAVLPAEMITPNGIDLKGQSSLTINGITITNVKDSTSYGEPPSTRKYYGQIAYTTLVLGDNTSNITTKNMPIFLVYSGTKVATGANAPLDPDPMVDGICGVNNMSTFNGDVITKRSQIKGPFSYLDYGPGVDAGISLDAINDADNVNLVSQSANRIIYSAPLLEVGIGGGSESEYIMQQQRLSTDGSTLIPQVHGRIYFGGEQFDGAVLFDTGTSFGESISDPVTNAPDTYVLDNNTPVSFSTKEGFSYRYATDQKAYATKIVPNHSGKLGRSIWGLPFFNDHYFLLDYTTNQIGISDI